MTREEVNGLDERIKELKLQHQEAERINLKNKAGELLVDINYLEELRELRNNQEPILNKIRTEIEELKSKIRKEHNYGADAVYGNHVIHGINAVLEIFDKYRA